MTPSLLTLLEETKKLITTDNRNQQLYSTPMRLDQLLEIREPVEHKGKFSILLDYTIHRLLEPRTMKLVKHRLQKIGRITTIAVDSSTRQIELPQGSILVGAVAITLNASYTIEYPSKIDSTLTIKGPGFIVPLLPRQFDDINPILLTSNPAGYNYDGTYSIEQALDELRLRLENWALKQVVPRILEQLARKDTFPVILVDGPIYPITMAHEKTRDYKNKYIEAWHRILEERLKIIDTLEAMGIPIIGIVKRLDKSLVLDRVKKSSKSLERCLPRGEYSDQHILTYYYQKCSRWMAGSLYSSPRITLIYSKNLPKPHMKILEYTVVPIGKWQQLYTPQSYRIEYSPTTGKILRENKLSAYHIMAHETVLRGSTRPISISVADYRSKQITKAITHYIASRIVESGYTLSYDGLIEAEVAWSKARKTLTV